MTLRYIIGRAGTGKTEQCLNEIRKTLRESPQGKPIILLVPEQATFQMELALANTPGLGGMVRAQVLSFRRLAWRVLQETGGASRVPIGELGKRMVLRRLLETNKGELRVFARSTNRPGFSDTLARAIGELKIYQIQPADLENAIEGLNTTIGLLKDKLQDLNLIYNKFSSYLEGRYTDPDDYLNLLAERLGQAPNVKGAQIWVDGFTGFTPQEFAVLENLLKYTDRVSVTLCLDPQDIDKELKENNVFYPTWETFKEINRRARRANIEIEKPLRLRPNIPMRFKSNTVLAHLEQNYFSYPLQKGTESTGLHLVAAANRRAEVESLSREIVRLCQEQDYRWRDIAVLLRDMDTYQDLLIDVFTDYNIPFFLDCKRNVLHHPLVELIRSVLEAVIKDWTYEPLFRCLKTDMLPLSREETDLLENYVLAHGIRGIDRWTGQKWNYRRKYTLGEDAELTDAEALELELINKSRERVKDALGDFSQKVKKAGSVREITTALYELLEHLNVPNTLQQWAVEAEQSGQLELAREHIQVWRGITGLFDEMVEAVEEENISLEDYLAILESGLENLRLGLIPPGLDQVVIGSLDRSRNFNVKAVFILGANDGVMPARQVDDGILNDGERQSLAEAGLVIAPGARRKAFDEQYLVYTALTRSKKYLWISYPMADDEGGTLTPSPIIGRIKEMFPGLKESFYQIEPSDISDSIDEYLINSERVLTYLATQLRELKIGREINPVWWDIYNWFLSSPEWQDKLAQTIQGVFHENKEKRISKKVSRVLYGQPLRASVSRIERFKACPFAHFSAYGLKLKDRPLFRLEAPDMGEFFHAALKTFTERLSENKLDWGELSRNDCTNLTGLIVDELAPELHNEILLSTARHRFLTGKLKRNVNRAALVLSEHARRSKFRPIGVELGFGPGGQLPPVNIKLSEDANLQLVGRIDRVDAAQKEGKDYLRVIDYKSSDTKLALPEIYYGLRMQLLTYLHVALLHSKQLIGRPGLPGAVLYFTVREPLIKSQMPLSPEQVEQKIIKELKMRGFLLGDPDVVQMMDSNITGGSSDLLPVALKKDGDFRANSPVATVEQFEALRCYLEQVFVESGEEILGGNVSINPYKYTNMSPCTFCAFKPVCQFDQLLEGNNYRILTKMSVQEVWECLLRKEGENERD